MLATIRRRLRRHKLNLLPALCLGALLALAGQALAAEFVTFPGDYRTLLASRPSGASTHGADGNSTEPAISQDAKWIAFVSTATDLGGSRAHPEIFARAVDSNRTMLVSRADGNRG